VFSAIEFERKPKEDEEKKLPADNKKEQKVETTEVSK